MPIKISLICCITNSLFFISLNSLMFIWTSWAVSFWLSSARFWLILSRFEFAPIVSINSGKTSTIISEVSAASSFFFFLFEDPKILLKKFDFSSTCWPLSEVSCKIASASVAASIFSMVEMFLSTVSIALSSATFTLYSSFTFSNASRISYSCSIKILIESIA